MHDPSFRRSCLPGWEGWMGRGDLAGAAHLQLASGVVQLRPEDAMVDAMLKGWRAQQGARGLREDTIAPRERLGGRVPGVTNQEPRGRGPAPVGGRGQTPALGGAPGRRPAPGAPPAPRPFRGTPPPARPP